MTACSFIAASAALVIEGVGLLLSIAAHSKAVSNKSLFILSPFKYLKLWADGPSITAW
jgi:hypothetical protein